MTHRENDLASAISARHDGNQMTFARNILIPIAIITLSTAVVTGTTSIVGWLAIGLVVVGVWAANRSACLYNKAAAAFTERAETAV